MNKKTVHYDSMKMKHIILGMPALVVPIDHPDTENVSNTQHVITSRVIRMFPNGNFETLNTLYVPR